MGQYYSRRRASGYFIPSPNDPYTYLQSLFTDGIILSARIGGLFNASLGNTSSPTGNVLNTHLNFRTIKDANGNMTSGMDIGLSFLKQVAEAQRQNEIAFIDARIKELKQFGAIGSEEQQIIDALEIAKNNPKQFDYKTFIAAFNMVITNLKRYITRLQGFKKTTTAVNTPQVNLVQQLEATLNDFAYYRSQFELKQEEMIRQLTLLYLKENGQEFIKNQVGARGVENLAAATAMIQQQLAQFLYDNGYLKYNKQEYSLKDFVQKINELKTKFKQFEINTNITNIFTNQQLLNEIKEMYGIEITSEMRLYQRKASQKASNDLNAVKQALQSDPIANKSKYFQNLMRHVHVKWKANSKFDNNLAYHDELVSALASAIDVHQHMGNKLNLGTDILLGHIVIDNNIPNNTTNNVVQSTLSNIKNRLLDNTVGHNADKISEIYLDEMQQLETSLNNLQHAFILHESNKNFNTLERGAWPQKNGKDLLFGRQDLNLFNYIDSISNLGANLGISTEWLKFAAYNLADNTLGAINKAPLESYFAIFAGMLMFDDFSIIGRDIAKQSMYNNITNIHLYKLQDTYYPASVFLEVTYQTLSSCLQNMQSNILAGNAFSVSINAPDVPYTGEEAPRLVDRWPVVRTFAETHNKITIEFAAGFLTLMRELLP